jgi:hypothetical protein
MKKKNDLRELSNRDYWNQTLPENYSWHEPENRNQSHPTGVEMAVLLLAFVVVLTILYLIIQSKK